MTHRTARKGGSPKADSLAPAFCVVLLGALGACSAEEPPANVSEDRGAAPAPPAAVAEPPAASVPAPAADAPVQQPVSSAPPASLVATLAAVAELMPIGDDGARGRVEFYLAQPTLAINVEITGLEPGNHGFHIHENGDCGGPAASAAGAHLNPHGAPHGDPEDDAQQRHAGDLGNVRAEDNGEVKQWLRTDELQLQGPAGIIGKALVVHAGDDDLVSQPGGESGNPVACGVIKANTW
jgi:Cu-Zn family superoxide dismutase